MEREGRAREDRSGEAPAGGRSAGRRACWYRAGERARGCRLEEGGVPIVDSHCHASECWYEPIEALLEQMARSGVDQAVLRQIAGQYDNSYQADCVRRFPARFASVVIVDTEQPDA